MQRTLRRPDEVPEWETVFWTTFVNTDVSYLGLNPLADVSKCLALVSQYLRLSVQVGTMGPVLQVAQGHLSSLSTVRGGFPKLRSSSVMLPKGLTTLTQGC